MKEDSNESIPKVCAYVYRSFGSRSRKRGIFQIEKAPIPRLSMFKINKGDYITYGYCTYVDYDSLQRVADYRSKKNNDRFDLIDLIR